MNKRVQKPSKLSDLPNRSLINGLSAVVIAALLFFAEFPFFRWVFASAIAAITAIALWEYYQLLKKKELQPAFSLGIVGSILYVFSVFLKSQSPLPLFPSFFENIPPFLLGALFFACFVYFAVSKPSPTINIATTFMGIVYIAIPLGLIIRIVFFFTYGGVEDLHFEGSWWVLYLIAVTKSSDMGGYFVGRHFGRKKLAFNLSPNKTLEGALGGLVSSTIMSLVICFLGKWVGQVFEDFSYWSALWMGILMGILGQMGDLAESLLKRDAKVKDSNKIPGVGGILDMIDSLLFTAPVVYAFLKIHYV